MLRNILFDLDGTLIDSSVGIVRSFHHLFERLGRVAPSDDVLRECIGPPLRDNIVRLLHTEDSEIIERCIGFYRERYTAHGTREGVVYAGIADLLDALRQNEIRCFVTTSKPLVFAEPMLAHFGLAAHFEAVYGTELGGAPLKKALIVERCLHDHGLDARHTAIVGDRVHDIVAGRATGVRTVGVTWGFGSREELEEADHLITTPVELISLARGT